MNYKLFSLVFTHELFLEQVWSHTQVEAKNYYKITSWYFRMWLRPLSASTYISIIPKLYQNYIIPETKTVGKQFFKHIYILIIGFENVRKLNFAFRIKVFLNGVEYWIYIGNVFSFTITILFLLSFLGILLAWSAVLQKEGEKTI